MALRSIKADLRPMRFSMRWAEAGRHRNVTARP